MKNAIVMLSAAVLVLSACGTARHSSVRNAPSKGQESEEINVGYGSVSQHELTYSVSQVKIDEKDIGVYDNIWDYMRGRVPGVVIGAASEGSTPAITIRGINSINSSTQPLILVDGIEMSDLTGLNPRDVDNVSVLKDASASIYGTRGASGVILITTKRAKQAAQAEAALKKEQKEAAKRARAEAKAARKAAKGK